MKNATPRKLSSAAAWISTVGGVGLLPIMPGSWCSLLIAIPALVVNVPVEQVQWAYAIAAVLFAVGGQWSVQRMQKEWGSDPQIIVIDEALGMSLVFLFPAASSGWAMWATSLFLFRVFDVQKPWPISAINNRTEAWAVMADDALAAGFTGISVQLVYSALMTLGVILYPGSLN